MLYSCSNSGRQRVNNKLAANIISGLTELNWPCWECTSQLHEAQTTVRGLPCHLATASWTSTIQHISSYQTRSTRYDQNDHESRCVTVVVASVLTYELDQGVYKFNWTNFQEIPRGISRKIQDMFALLRPAMQCTKSTSLSKYRTKTWYAQHGAVAKIKKGDQFLK